MFWRKPQKPIEHAAEMTELINFRDFGGMPAAAGQWVRADRLYRGGHLGRLAKPAFARLLALDFRVIADLRYVGERAEEPSPWPEPYAERVCAHGGARPNVPHIGLLLSGRLTRELVEQFYREFYAELPFDPLYRPLFARVIGQIAASPGRALVHCTAGKDRTGVFVALLLSALGVPRDVITAEYMQSSQVPALLAMRSAMLARAKRCYSYDIPADALEALWDVQPGYLDAMFCALEARCGSVQAYLAEGGLELGVIARLREALLEAGAE
jgi:protein-tyrosine phosphatase